MAIGPNAGLGACTQLMNNTRLFVQGDYERNPLENSQVGVRYHGIAPFGMEFTLNYFYQRWAGDDGTNYAQLKGLPTNPKNDALSADLLNQGIFPAEFIAPYVHTFGASANYSDETFTQTVYRFETILDFGIPFYDAAKTTVVDGLLPGVTNKNMWKGMIAFDRPTWIKWLNKKSTIFLTGQWFWHYLMNNPGWRLSGGRAGPGGGAQPGRLVPGRRPRPAVDRPSQDRRLPRQDPHLGVDLHARRVHLLSRRLHRPDDRHRGRPGEPVQHGALLERRTTSCATTSSSTSASTTSSRRAGRSTPIFETWGLAGFNRGRSETILRVTFQF